MDSLDKIIFAASILIGAVGCSGAPAISSTADEIRASMRYVGESRDEWRVCGVLNPKTGKREGDCEDFALCAITRLRAKGIEATMGVYNDPSRCSGDSLYCYHAVAVVGDWIIDNGRMRPRNQLKFDAEWKLEGGTAWMIRARGKTVKVSPTRNVIAGPS